MAFDGPTPGVDGVVSYSTAIRLNFRFLRVFGLAGLKFSLSESDSKFPMACLDFNDSLCSCRSSESLNVGLTLPSTLLYASAGLLLSSVGCGAQAANLLKFLRLDHRVMHVIMPVDM